MGKKVRKTTLAESPRATSRLTNIQPDEVSAVDMPAIGEPFIVVKGMNGLKQKDTSSYHSEDSLKTRKRSRQMSKLTTEDVPRMVMKAVESRLRAAITSVDEITSVVKSLPAEENAPNEVPEFLVDMTKAAAMEIRSLQPNYSVAKRQRGMATSVRSIHDLTKRAEDIEKANAISYLYRDQYVNVTQSVSEYLSTYVDGVEHDDDGPILIPSNLDSTIDKTAEELEKLADESDVSESSKDDEPEIEPDEVAEVAKLNGEINRLKSLLTSPANKAGAKMAAGRLKRFRGVSSGISDASSELSKLIDELEKSDDEEDGGDEDMSGTNEETTKKTDSPDDSDKTETTKSVGESTETQKETMTEEQTEKSQGDGAEDSSRLDKLEKGFETLLSKLDDRFDSIEKKFDEGIADVRKKTEATAEDVKKFSLSRSDSKADPSDETVKTHDTKKSAGSFAGILGIPEDAK